MGRIRQKIVSGLPDQSTVENPTQREIPDNEGLKPVYDEMHSRGPAAWFSDGANERDAILKMGEPWTGLNILEIGCGEGDLLNSIGKMVDKAIAVDYSHKAVMAAREKYPHLTILEMNYQEYPNDEKYSRLVLQGVLEHLNRPFPELKWMMDNFLGDKGDVVCSCPRFDNPRGWALWGINLLRNKNTENKVNRIISKTDLHYLEVDQFIAFCNENGYRLDKTSTDHSWANGEILIRDFRDRIPKAFADAEVDWREEDFEKELEFLRRTASKDDIGDERGATAVYKITKG